MILISDSIMVPCYGRKTPNTKGCVNLVFVSALKEQVGSDVYEKSLGQESYPDKFGQQWLFR